MPDEWGGMGNRNGNIETIRKTMKAAYESLESSGAQSWSSIVVGHWVEAMLRQDWGNGVRARGAVRR